MKKSISNVISLVLTAAFFLTTACVPQTPPLTTSGIPAGSLLNTPSQAAPIQRTVLGPDARNNESIELKFDTALLGGKYTGPHKIIPWKSVAGSSRDFSTLAIPSGPLVFQEVFVRDKAGGKTEQRQFSISDTSKQYTLHIQNGDAQGKNTSTSVVVNINGFDWIRPNEVKKQTPEVQKGTIILQANNTLTIDHQGSPGSTFTLTIVEAGQAGTIRRRNGPLNEHPTQDGHEKAHDKTIFDPADPTSLGDLLPSLPGNNNMAIPETKQATISLNNTPPTPVLNGQVLVAIAEPVQQNLQQLLSKYNAQVLDGPDATGFYLLQADMTKISLANLEQDLSVLNTQVADPRFLITQASFGDLESARTFALSAALLTDPMIKGVGFNFTMEEDAVPQVKTKEEFPIPYLNPNSTIFPILNKYMSDLSAEQSWWLNDNSTHVTRAWNYSQGYLFDSPTPRRVKVAVISGAFGGLSDANQPGEDLDGQLLLSQSKRIQALNTDANPQFKISSFGSADWNDAVLANDDDLPGGDTAISHGTMLASTIASKANDGKGVVGVAPQAIVVPYRISYPFPNYWEVKEAIRVAAENNVDIINLSLGGSLPADYLLRWIAFVKFNLNFTWYAPMQVEVRKAADKGVIIVASAGNGGWNIERGSFAGRKDEDGNLVFPEIIPVGAIDDLDPAVFNAPHDLVRAYYEDPPFSSDHDKIRGHSSNWGDIGIWAPGRHRTTLAPVRGNNKGLLPNEEGTSSATPLVAGIMALLKARNPNINNKPGDPLNALQLLRRTALVNQSLETRLRGFPYLKDGAVCTPYIGVTCGDILPPQTIELRIVNALQALEDIQPDPAQAYEGALALDAGNNVTLNVSGGASLQLAWAGHSNKASIGQFFAEDLTGNAVNSVSVDSLITTNAYVRVDGWKRGTTLNILQMKKVSPTPVPTPSSSASSGGTCTTDQVITNTAWKWVDGLTFKNAVISTGLMGFLNIPLTTDGRQAVPIWSEINTDGTATCSGCQFIFFFDYQIPVGASVSEAKVQVQADDSAVIEVNGVTVGSANFASTFGIQSYKEFTVPANALTSGTNMLKLQFLGGNAGGPANFAGIAAKFDIKRCQ